MARFAACIDAPQDRQQQRERRNRIQRAIETPPLRAVVPIARGARSNIRWASDRPGHPAGKLHGNIRGHVAPRRIATRGEYERHGRIEVCPRDGPRMEISTTKIAPVGIVFPRARWLDSRLPGVRP